MSLVSAIPGNLTSYGAAAIEMDARLNLQGGRLQSAIDALNSSAPDPKFLGPLPALGSQVAAFGSGNAAIDAWVGDVGNAFANADQGHPLPGGVVQAQQSLINALVKGEEPQGAAARGALLLRAQEAGKNGFLDLLPSGHATLTWLLANKWWITKVWGFGAKGGQLPTVLASLLKGYRLVPSADGKYIIAKGWRFLSSDDSWLEQYIQSGRLAGTRYLADNGAVARYFNLKTMVNGDLSKAFNPSDSAFWKAAPKAGGAAAMTLMLGSDIYNYGWGSDRKQGFGNQFAAAVTVDGATTAGTIALSDAAATAGGTAMGAMIGGEAGSVVPGLGTVIGIGVGAGVGWFMSTGTGKALRSEAVNLVASGFHDGEKLASGAWDEGKKVVNDLNPVNWF